MRDTTFTTSTGYDANDATRANIRAYLESAAPGLAFSVAVAPVTAVVSIPDNCCCNTTVVTASAAEATLRA